MTTDQVRLDSHTSRVIFRSRLASFTPVACGVAAAGLAALGTFTLFGRSALGIDAPGPYGVWIGAALLVAATALGIALSKRRGLDRAGAATWLDVQSGASGQLVTADELGERAALWSARAETKAASVDTEFPVEWRRPTILLVCAALFAAAMTFVPLRAGLAGAGLSGLFEERIEEVREEIAALDEELDLDAEDKAALEDALERLEQDIEADPDLESTYEAIDRLEEQLAARADEAVEAARRSLEALGEAAAEAAASAQAPQNPQDAQDPQGAEKLDDEAAERVVEALEAAKEALEAFDQTGLAAGESGFDSKDLEQMLEKAGAGEFDSAAAVELSKEMREALAEALENLDAAGLVSSTTRKSMGELPELTSEQLEMLEAAAKMAAANAAPCPDCGRTDPKEPGEP